MSSLVRSLASLYCQGLRRTVRLGAGAPPPPALDQRRPFLSKVERTEAGAATRSPPRRQKDGERTPLLTWARLAIASAVAAMAPFLQSKWAALLRIQSEMEMVKDAAEMAAEVAEEVAVAAERASAEVAEQLPENGRLRRAAVLVEQASKEVAEEAHLAQDIIHKVEEIEEDVKAMIEPIIDAHKHKPTIKKH
uniref:Pterin-binding domain-containing protein n=1 Tax=Oryza brachyantha TaxID=4533 RepID=J3N274_ORYBR